MQFHSIIASPIGDLHLTIKLWNYKLLSETHINLLKSLHMQAVTS